MKPIQNTPFGLSSVKFFNYLWWRLVLLTSLLRGSTVAWGPGYKLEQFSTETFA